MTRIFTLSFLLLLITSSEGQNTKTANDASHPCISELQYALIEKQCNENIALLKLDNASTKRVSLALKWPLQAAAALKDCHFYHISAYVDQNTAVGSFKDFNCGTNSYDGHGGTDISIWPYNFYKMDNDLVEVIAAAGGTIIDKHDGETDKNCGTNALTANYVVIQHGDGSRAMYWHMKKNSVTAKTIGQTVVTGEKLGVVGSSGNSSGPHLHFEVWSGSTSATRVDPFSGTCNTLNANSWWYGTQPGYKETQVMKASVHTTDIVIPACPGTEVLNESTSYTIPFQGAGLSPGYAKFYMFLRDETNGLSADLSILNPDNSVNQSWTYTSTADRKTLMWGFSKKLPTIAGKYTFKATYNGTTCSSTFDIVTTSGFASPTANPVLGIYPNPSNGQFIIETSVPNGQIIVIANTLGEIIYQSEILNTSTTINLNSPTGIYFYRVIENGQTVSVGKIVVE